MFVESLFWLKILIIKIEAKPIKIKMKPGDLITCTQTFPARKRLSAQLKAHAPNDNTRTKHAGTPYSLS
jgi:hypothetical protein